MPHEGQPPRDGESTSRETAPDAPRDRRAEELRRLREEIRATEQYQQVELATFGFTAEAPAAAPVPPPSAAPPEAGGGATPPDTSFGKTSTLQFDTDALRKEGLDPSALRSPKSRRSRRQPKEGS